MPAKAGIQGDSALAPDSASWIIVYSSSFTVLIYWAQGRLRRWSNPRRLINKNEDCFATLAI